MKHLFKLVVPAVLGLTAVLTLTANNTDRPQSHDYTTEEPEDSVVVDSSGFIDEVATLETNYAIFDSLGEVAREVFININASPLDMLTQNMRLDMLDYYDAGRSHLQKNTTNGFSRLDTVSNNYLCVTTSDVSRYAIRILKTKKSTPIVMTLYTVGGDGQSADTDIRFYNIQLQELPRNKFWQQPELNDYLNLKDVSKQTRLNIENEIPFPTFEFDASSADNVVIGKLTVKDYLSDESYRMVEKYIIPQVSYIWNNSKGRFNVVKSN